MNWVGRANKAFQVPSNTLPVVETKIELSNRTTNEIPQTKINGTVLPLWDLQPNSLICQPVAGIVVNGDVSLYTPCLSPEGLSQPLQKDTLPSSLVQPKTVFERKLQTRKAVFWLYIPIPIIPIPPIFFLFSTEKRQGTIRAPQGERMGGQLPAIKAAFLELELVIQGGYL